MRVDHTKVPHGKVVAQLVMDDACFVQQLVTLRYSRGVGVVCHRRDDVGVMSLWAVTTKRALYDGVRWSPGVQPWHKCPTAGSLTLQASTASLGWRLAVATCGAGVMRRADGAVGRQASVGASRVLAGLRLGMGLTL